MKRKTWKIAKSAEIYNIEGWGGPYFSINRNGHVAVHPKGTPKRSFSLKTLVDQILERGIQTPFLLRFNDILIHRLNCINTAFQNAISEFDYNGDYAAIYPIKVNQQRHVVEQIANFCLKTSFGLEAGSKPELVAVLALTENVNTPIICNGYKDREYFEIVMLAAKMGKPIYPVIEKFSEFKTLISVSNEMGVKPNIGVRIKLSSSGSGRWQSSGGHRSKFGLTFTELLRGVELLKEHDMIECVKLLHFHLGSQITDISAIKKALDEAARVYVEISNLGLPVEIMDVGGGLGIDYNGSSSSQESSVNYTLQEYANDVVFRIKEICDEAKIKHPHIFTECGRAIAAHHAILVLNILGISGYDRSKLPSELDDDQPKPLHSLLENRQTLKYENVLEHYHDAVAAYHECLNLFGLGYLSIQQRGLAEEIYFSILKRCQTIIESEEELPEELRPLEEMLSDTYFANFSVFQSLPDHWAIDQQFPIMPLHRLNEEPSVSATIADITCDSDGKIDLFIHPKGKRSVIKLHPHDAQKEYYLGAFLVGAYQETLGDLHNLFGDTNAVHITMDNNGHPVIENVVKGDTVKEVLTYVQYDVNDLIEKMHRQLERAVRAGKIDFKESGNFLKYYETAMEGYTYLEDTESESEF